MSEVLLKINNRIYSTWKSIRITRALSCFASSFNLSVSDKELGTKGNIPLDAPCEVLIDEKKVFTGYLDEVSPNYDESTHTVTFGGRSKTADLVDCSAIIGTGQILNGTPEEIIRRILAPFKIGLHFNAGLKNPIPDFQLQPGETAAAAIERICAMNSLVVTDDTEGNLIIEEIGMGISVGELRHTLDDSGKNNILRGGGVYSRRDRFSEYRILSQMNGSDFVTGEDASGVEGISVDPEIKRYRPLIITGESSMNEGDAAARAEWEKVSRKGKSTRLNFMVHGWQNSEKQIWSPNSYVSIKDDFISIDGKLIISSVSLIYEKGETTELELSPPEAFSKKIQTKSYHGWKELEGGV